MQNTDRVITQRVVRRDLRDIVSLTPSYVPHNLFRFLCDLYTMQVYCELN